MKKILIILMLTACSLQAQFVEFKDNATKNSFTGVGLNQCSIKGLKSKDQKSYDCGNDTISRLLNVNILTEGLLGHQFYIFNDFIYWMNESDGLGAWNGKDAAKAKKAAQANANPDEVFSGTGVFMIEFGTSAYLQNIVAPNKKCPAGQTLVAGQLKSNNGNSLASWSQDSICLAPTDTFGIQITKDRDDSVPFGPVESSVDAQGVDWMKDGGPTRNYEQAGSSPRKLRFVLKTSSASDSTAAQQPADEPVA